jgi:hypothetical protein
LALFASACDDAPPTSRVDELVSAAQTTRPKAPPPPPKVWDKIPDVIVDDLGAYIGGERARLGEKEGPAKLKDIVSRLPIKDQTVPVNAQRNSLIRDVSAVVWELTLAGAKDIVLKTDGRDELPTEIVITPETKIKDVPGCTVCVMVNDKLDTGVWKFDGGLGTKHGRGLAGPDLSNTEETLRERFTNCNSDVAFFGGSFIHKWEHVFNLGGLIKKADDEKKIKRVVLLTAEPVAGRKVELRRK